MSDEKGPPAPAVLAASVLVLRDAPHGPEVLMVRRRRNIEFAGGALVFPGGKVDSRDEAAELAGACIGGPGLSREARACRIAAAREAFEEAGVLVALDGAADGSLDAELLEPLRAPLASGEFGFERVLAAARTRLDLDALVPFGHWITPVYLPKRFDTHFFLAAGVAGLEAVHDGGEAEEAIWISPREALAGGEEGRLGLMFPTRMNLRLLAAARDAADAVRLARARKVVTVEPVLATAADGRRVLKIPLEAGYGIGEEPVESVMGRRGPGGA